MHRDKRLTYFFEPAIGHVILSAVLNTFREHKDDKCCNRSQVNKRQCNCAISNLGNGLILTRLTASY